MDRYWVVVRRRSSTRHRSSASSVSRRPVGCDTCPKWEDESLLASRGGHSWWWDRRRASHGGWGGLEKVLVLFGDARDGVHTAVLMNALPVGNDIRPSELHLVQRRAVPCVCHCRMRTSHRSLGCAYVIRGRNIHRASCCQAIATTSS